MTTCQIDVNDSLALYDAKDILATKINQLRNYSTHKLKRKLRGK